MSQDAALWESWRAAAARAEVDAALRQAYQRLDEAVQARGPVCWASGRCCHFAAYGHRLYVTGLEIAWFLPQVPRPAEPWPQGACPFQVDTLCSVHPVRPLGCRIFFCQRGTEDWQHEVYEQFLADLRRLHDQHALDYRYMEWLTGLRGAYEHGVGVSA